MRGATRAVPAAALLLALAAPAHGPEVQLVGCWSLQVGAWEPPLEGHDPGFPPPAWFELRGRRGGGEGPAVYGGEWSRRERHWKWSRLKRGGVAIVFASGYAGYHLRMEPVGDRLEGTIEAFRDLGRRARAPVTAVRTPCPKGGRR